MGDFGVDTRVEGSGGRYTAKLSSDWEIWGPCGGYVATVALRAAGAHSGLPRPATFTCHFLGVAAFDEVDLTTQTLREGKRSASVRVSMQQRGRPILEALVWTIADTGGRDFDHTAAPAVPGPHEVPTIAERLPEEESPYRFWSNFEYRPIDWLDRAAWTQRSGLEPRNRAWFRFVPTPRFDDPYTEAGRALLLLDVTGWPAACRAHDGVDDEHWMAPNIDVSAAFHQAPDDEYLLADAEAPLSTGGLAGATSRVWTADGRLVATAVQQMLYRNVTPPHLTAKS